MNSRGETIVRFILALALTIVGAIYVLFFAAGGYFITAVASAMFLGVGLIWLSDFSTHRIPRDDEAPHLNRAMPARSPLLVPKALNRHIDRMFDLSRKDHHSGRGKLARDR